MRSENRRFRPMGVADILDEVVDLYKSNFALLLGVAAILYVPISVFNGLTGHQTARSGSMNWITLLMMPFEAIVTGALAYGISERYLNRQVSIIDCYRRILNPKMLLPLLGAVLVKYAIVIGPVIALMAAFPAPTTDPSRLSPELAARVLAQMLAWMALAMLGLAWAFLFGVKLLLVEPALVIERKSAFGSLARSWSGMKGSFWKAAGIYMLVGLVVGIIFMMVVGPVLFPISRQAAIGGTISASSRWLLTILSTIVGTLSMPVSAATRILIYYDVRIRKEAFDLEMLAAELDRKVNETEVGDITALPQEKPVIGPSEGESQ